MERPVIAWADPVAGASTAEPGGGIGYRRGSPSRCEPLSGCCVLRPDLNLCDGVPVRWLAA